MRYAHGRKQTPAAIGGKMPEYTVQYGDTMRGIASKCLGKENRWVDIAKLNGLKGSDTLFVGQKLMLPGAKPLDAANDLVSPFYPGSSTVQSDLSATRATLALARGSLFVVVEQLSDMSGKLIRKVLSIPKDFSLVPRDPQGVLTFAEHAIGGEGAASQFLSASERLFGAANFNGVPLLIDIAKAEAAGAKIVTVEQILTDLRRYLGENPNARHLERLIEIIETTEREVLIEGKVVGKAIKRLSNAHNAYVRSAEELWKKFLAKDITKSELAAELLRLERSFGKARVVGRIGRVLTVVGVVFTLKDIAEASQRSLTQKSFKPLAAESIRQAGGWGGAIAGGEAGFAAGALFGIETGPGAIVTGALGAVIFGGLAYFGFDLLADQISPN